MPHLLIQGSNDQKCIKVISIHAHIVFQPGYYKSSKRFQKIEELQAELEKVVQKYFEEYSSEEYSNHEWNCRTNNS